MNLCEHCEEPILPEEKCPVENIRMHKECLFRLVMGSVAHIEGRCGCHIPGSIASDPEGMTLRHAARASMAAYARKQGASTDSSTGQVPGHRPRMNNDFQPVFSERSEIRWGMLPTGQERSLGRVGIVSLQESLRIYRAALKRTRIEFREEFVMLQKQDGSTETYNWAGEPV